VYTKLPGITVISETLKAKRLKSQIILENLWEQATKEPKPKGKRTDNNLQNTTQKTKNRARTH
jgi:hypothetical protein